MKPIIEVCCGSALDAISAYKGNADRIELNSALALGGLTPTCANLILAKKYCSIPIICMVRNRGAGFCYREDEMEVMLMDAKLLLEQGADGLAFGALHEDGTLHEEYNGKMIQLAHHYNKEFVFHRALDVTADLEASIQTCIDWKVDRVLTSGGKEKASQALALLKKLQDRYGQQIEILAGSGVNSENAQEILQATGLSQLHSSCKDWLCDPTTVGQDVNYSYAAHPHQSDYEIVSQQKVSDLTSQ